MNSIRHATLALATLVLTACGGMYGMETGSSGKMMNDGGAPAMARDGVLTNSAGMSLYTFDRDPADASKSACNGQCAINWPPLMASAGASGSGDWAVVTRDDGSKQWAYKGKPVYLWIKDTKPGDRTGDGVNNVWHVAKP
jgi:predicted lipoprotein with Yx(FWY)xxD motif